MNQRDRDVLQASALLKDLPQPLVRRILDHVTVASLEARDVIFREGAEADCFYAVLTGYVRLYRTGKDGREADTGIFGPGDVFGECMMLLECHHAFGAQAAEPATLARFDLARMRDIARQEPEFALSVMAIMARHISEARENVANDRLHTAPQRVAHYLLALADANGNASAIRLPFQKSLLAGKLGLAPEALSRAFSLLRTAGVEIRGRTIHISDTNALRNL